MKILSLWQPWASLWVAGAPIAKGVETRSWGTSYRGPVAVHAAKHWDLDLEHLCGTKPFAEVLWKLGIGCHLDLPRGAILGRVDLVACLRMGFELGEINISNDPRLTVQETAFGDYRPGRFAWVTGAARHILAEPIPFRGAQGLRDLPADVAARIA